MAECIVHVGLPKCGSTALQAFLVRNREPLAAQGVFYDPPGIDRWSHLELGLAACDRLGLLVPDRMLQNRLGLRDLSAQRERVATFEAAQARRRVPRAGMTVFSSEHLSAWLRTPELRGALDRWFSERFDRVAYLMVIRPQTEFVLSSWSESIRRGSPRDLDAFVAGYDEIDVVAEAQSWSASFGDRFHVAKLPAGGEAEHGGELLTGFVACLGADGTDLDAGRSANRALSAPAAFLLRGANRVLGADVRRGPVRRALFAALRAPTVRLLSGAARLQLTKEQCATIQARYPAPLEEGLPGGRDAFERAAPLLP